MAATRPHSVARRIVLSLFMWASPVGLDAGPETPGAVRESQVTSIGYAVSGLTPVGVTT